MPSLSRRVRGRLAPLGLALAVVGLAAAWAMASPVGGTPDEPAHVEYAWGVATGQVLPGNERVVVDENGASVVHVRMPTSLLEYENRTCYQGDPSASPGCGWESSLHPQDEVDRPTYMTRYPPLYYGVVGTVLRVGLEVGLSGHHTLLLARFVSGVLSLGMVAGAALVLARRGWHAGAAVAVLAGLTPVMLSLASSVNPNGFEVGAAVLGAALVVAVRHDHAGAAAVRTPTVTALLLALVALTWTRPLSLVWAFLLVGVLLLPGGPLGGLWQRHRWAVVAAGASLVAAVAWLGWATQTRVIGEEDDSVDWGTIPVDVRTLLVLLKFGDLVRQMVGWIGWDTTLPDLAVVGWVGVTVVAVTLLVTGSARASTRLRDAWGFLGLSAAVVAAYSMLTAFGWQGRYLLPAVAAGLVLAVPSMQGASLSATTLRRTVVVSSAWFLTVQLGALSWFLWRYMYGVESVYARFAALPLRIDDVGWIPPVSQAVVLGLGLVGTLALGAALVGPVVVAARTAAAGDGHDAPRPVRAAEGQSK